MCKALVKLDMVFPIILKGQPLEKKILVDLLQAKGRHLRTNPIKKRVAAGQPPARFIIFGPQAQFDFGLK